MTNINAMNFRKNLFGMLEQTIRYNEPVTIRTKVGNAVLLSEKDYCSLIETLYLCSTSGLGDKIVEGINTPMEDCIPEEGVEW